MIRIQENTPTTVGSSNVPAQQQPRINYLLRQNNQDRVSFRGNEEQNKKNSVWGWIAGIAVVAAGIFIAVKSKKGSEVNKALEKGKDVIEQSVTKGVEDLTSNGISRYDNFDDEADYGRKYTNRFRTKNRRKHKINKFRSSNPRNVKTTRYEGALSDGKKFFVDLDKDGNVISIVRPDGSFTENPKSIKIFFKKNNKIKNIAIKKDDNIIPNNSQIKKQVKKVKPESKPEKTPRVATKYSTGNKNSNNVAVDDVKINKSEKQRVIPEPKKGKTNKPIDSEIKPDQAADVTKESKFFGKFKKLGNKVSGLLNKVSENIDNFRYGVEETRIQNRANKLARKGAKHERDMEILAKKSQAADLASEFNNQKLGNKLAQNDIKLSIREQKLADNIAKKEAALLIEKQNEALRLAEKEAKENLGQGISDEVEAKRGGFFGLFKRTKESLPKPEAKLNEVKTEKPAKEPNYIQRKYAEFKANSESKKAARELPEEQNPVKKSNYFQRKYDEFSANRAAKKIEKEAEAIAAKKPIEIEEQAKEPSYFQRKIAEGKDKFNQALSGTKSKFSDVTDKFSGFFKRKQKPVEIEEVADIKNKRLRISVPRYEKVAIPEPSTKKKSFFGKLIENIDDSLRLKSEQKRIEKRQKSADAIAEKITNQVEKLSVGKDRVIKERTPKFKFDFSDWTQDDSIPVRKVDLSEEIKAFDEHKQMQEAQKIADNVDSWTQMHFPKHDQKYSIDKAYKKMERKTGYNRFSDKTSNSKPVELQEKAIQNKNTSGLFMEKLPNGKPYLVERNNDGNITEMINQEYVYTNSPLKVAKFQFKHQVD